MSATRVSRKKKTDPLKPRKTPAQERSQGTVEIILEAAAHILEKKGLTGFNTNRIAERAGVSIGSIYQYFPNKDALMVALIEKFEGRVLSSLKTAIQIAENKPLDEALRILLRAVVAMHADRPDLNRILEFEDRRLLRNSDHSETIQQIHSLVIQFLKQHPQVPDSLDAEETGKDLLLMARAFTDSALENADPDFNRLEERLFRAVRGYLQLSIEPRP